MFKAWDLRVWDLGLGRFSFLVGWEGLRVHGIQDILV